MVKLEMSPHLGRKIRREGWKELGMPSWTAAEQLIRDGKIKEGLELFEYARFSTNARRNNLCRLFDTALKYIGDNMGDEHIERFWMNLEKELPNFRRNLTAGTVEEAVQIDADIQHGHHCGPTGLGDLTIVEEPDRYVVTLDPCGSGGRVIRDGIGGVTKKAYPWSWGKAGVPYHCCHCAVLWEITPIEERGYPLKIHENVGKVNEPCIHLYYKSPELIPEHYFTRVGKKRDPSRFPGSKKGK